MVDDAPTSLLYVGYMLRFGEEARNAYTSVAKLGYAGMENQRNSTFLVVGDDKKSLLYVGYFLRFEYEHACLHIRKNTYDMSGWPQKPQRSTR